MQEQAAIARRMYQLHGALEQLRSREGQASLVVQEPAAGGVVRVEQTAGKAPAWIAGLEAERALEAQAGARVPSAARRVAHHGRALSRRSSTSSRCATRSSSQDLFTESLSAPAMPKVSLPRYSDWGDILTWLLTEAPPGMFPFTAGVFPLKREGEDPARMFAGEGGPERTNRRFHYVSRGMPAKRLSTAFDSVTLYGENPARRPDIYGKIGNCRRERRHRRRRQEALLRLRPLRSRRRRCR